MTAKNQVFHQFLILLGHSFALPQVWGKSNMLLGKNQTDTTEHIGVEVCFSGLLLYYCCAI